MLVLTRKPGERIIIDDQITVTVLAVRGHQIRLGIEAPKEIPIKREELLGAKVAAA
jgi:carbon storage regulator